MYTVRIGFGIGFDRNGRIIPDIENKVSLVLRLASQAFGGASLIPVRGGWVNPAGQLVVEAGYSLVLCNIPVSTLGDARIFAGEIKNLLGQQSVMFSAVQENTQFL